MIELMTPKQRVFGTLRNLQRIVGTAMDLNDERERLGVALDRCLSWEDEVQDVVTHNAEVSGAGTASAGLPG